MEARDDPAEDCQEPNWLVENQRETQARNREHCTPNGGFRTDITNRGRVERVKKSETDDESGEGTSNLNRMVYHRESAPVHLERRKKIGAKCSSGGRNVFGLVLYSDGDPFHKCRIAFVHKEIAKICRARRRVFKDWTDFSLTELPRATQCFVDAKKRGALLCPLQW